MGRPCLGLDCWMEACQLIPPIQNHPDCVAEVLCQFFSPPLGSNCAYETLALEISQWSFVVNHPCFDDGACHSYQQVHAHARHCMYFQEGWPTCNRRGSWGCHPRCSPGASTSWLGCALCNVPPISHQTTHHGCLVCHRRCCIHTQTRQSCVRDCDRDCCHCALVTAS